MTQKNIYDTKKQAQRMLRNAGIETRETPHYAPFSLYTKRGTRIKVARTEFRTYTRPHTNGRWDQRTSGWFFVTHRRGKLYETDIDFYVLVCNPSPINAPVFGREPFFVVTKSPIKNKAPHVTVESLVLKNPRFLFRDCSTLKSFDESKSDFDNHRWKPWEHWVLEPNQYTQHYLDAYKWLADRADIYRLPHMNDNGYFTANSKTIAVIRQPFSDGKRFEGWKFQVPTDANFISHFYLLQGYYGNGRHGQASPTMHRLVSRKDLLREPIHITAEEFKQEQTAKDIRAILT